MRFSRILSFGRIDMDGKDDVLFAEAFGKTLNHHFIWNGISREMLAIMTSSQSFELLSEWAEEDNFGPHGSLFANYMFRKNARELVGPHTPKEFRALEPDSKELTLIQAIYAACFYPYDKFSPSLRAPETLRIRSHLISIRKEVAAGLSRCRLRKNQMEVYNRRRGEWLTAPIDIVGKNNVEILSQMTPDDWHEYALTCNWSFAPFDELQYVTGSPYCDKATALVIFFGGLPLDRALHPNSSVPDRSLLLGIAERLRDGYYANSRFSLETVKAVQDWKIELKEINNLGLPEWSVPSDAFDTLGCVTHKSKYTSSNNKLLYNYDWWLENSSE